MPTSYAFPLPPLLGHYKVIIMVNNVPNNIKPPAQANCLFRCRFKSYLILLVNEKVFCMI